MAAQEDPRFRGQGERERFPILVVIAQDEIRLREYYGVLRSAALARQLPLPRAYFTTITAMLSLRQDPRRPIWFSTVSNQRVPLLFDVEGIVGPPPGEVPWRKITLVSDRGHHDSTGYVSRRENLQAGNDTSTKEINTLFGEEEFPSKQRGLPRDQKNLAEEWKRMKSHQSEFVRLALELAPLGKELLEEIAAHPLRTQLELAILLQKSRRRVRLRLAELMERHLIEQQGNRYLLAPSGVAYLAIVAGFGNAVRRYARTRGWVKGLTCF